MARRIQRCYRKWCLRQRINTLINIAKYVSQIESNKLYLEQTVYIHLESIFAEATSPPWYRAHLTSSHQTKTSPGASRPGSKATTSHFMSRRSVIKNVYKPLYHEISQALFEKRFKFQINPKDSRVRISYTGKIDKANRYQDSNLP